MYKLFFQIILLHSIAFCHQFFLTTTEVRLSDNQKSLQITIQTFTHDVEALLKKADFNLANLGSERENKDIDEYIIDDLSDTGITLNKSIDWLKNYEPIKGKIEDIKTATLWKKKKSTFDPDYCAVKLEDNPWIVQPFEHYEEIRIEDIKKKHPK